MIECKLYLPDTGQLLKVIYELRDHGLIQGVDFDYAWYVTRYSNENFNFEIIEKSHGLFMFHREQWATWFSLKYL